MFDDNKLSSSHSVHSPSSPGGGGTSSSFVDTSPAATVEQESEELSDNTDAERSSLEDAQEIKLIRRKTVAPGIGGALM